MNDRLEELKSIFLAAEKTNMNFEDALVNDKFTYDFKAKRAKVVIDGIQKLVLELHQLMPVFDKFKTDDDNLIIVNQIGVNFKFLNESRLKPSKSIPIIERIQYDMRRLKVAGPVNLADTKQMTTDSQVFEIQEKKEKPVQKEQSALGVPSARTLMEQKKQEQLITTQKILQEEKPAPVEKTPGEKGRVEAARGKIVFPDYTNLPSDVAEDINADLQELERCFSMGSYRSSVILCGRLLEVALHRKYYDATGFDILEKNPGIGLGNLIAKLKQKEVELDPAITQQIHLINQTRIFSVHKKREAFRPSKTQAHAIILYTLDILGNLFSN